MGTYEMGKMPVKMRVSRGIRAVVVKITLGDAEGLAKNMSRRVERCSRRMQFSS